MIRTHTLTMPYFNYNNHDTDQDLADSNNDKNTEWSSSDIKIESKKSDSKSKQLTVEYFATDLTKESQDGFVDPVIGRDAEINQVIYTLLRKTKNNPLLIGEAWVGKTAIVEWLAHRINAWQVPDKLKNKRIMMLDVGTLVAGTKYRWEFEARMKAIFEESIDPANQVILFIDELHTVIWAGSAEGTWDIANLLKPMLARGKIKLIGATTYNEYQKYIEKDAALKRRFQEIHVWEPSATDTIQILKWLKNRYEDFHGVSIEDQAIESAVNLSKRYMLNKHLPDKAIDIIDEACARKSTMAATLEKNDHYKIFEKKLEQLNKQLEDAITRQDYFTAAELKDQEDTLKIEIQKVRQQSSLPKHLRTTIDIVDIWQVMSDKLGIPSNLITESETTKLLRLENDLSTKLIGQDEAIKAVVTSIKRSRLSPLIKQKPIASFLFLGPSGVGKTYLAKLIAQDYFWSEQNLIRVDMSEFMEKYSVSKLIWSAPGYIGHEEGGILTEAVRRKPYSVILLDEIEKASPDVLNVLLQILDEWQLKDNKGRMIDFKSTIIILTSNLGSQEFAHTQSKIWFSTSEKKESDSGFDFGLVKERIMEKVEHLLSPELLNRLDYKIVFRPLSKSVLLNIFKLKLKDFLQAWSDKHKDLKLPKFTNKKYLSIIDSIYNPSQGARPIDRYIQDHIESELIDRILSKD